MFTTYSTANGARRQIEAWLPYLLVKLNYSRTRELIPALTALPIEEKVARAVVLFEQLLTIESDAAQKTARQWSLDYFRACALGPQARREFLVAEGIYRRGDLLRCPDRVQPQMEICNLNPRSYPSPLREEARAMTELMFQEFLAVKNLLSLPDGADFIATLAGHIPLLGMVQLSAPRLKLSLLIEDYVKQTVAEAQRVDGTPLIAIFGPGKGEELVPLTRRGFSILCLDAHSYATIKSLFQSTFDTSGVPAPQMIAVCENTNVDMTAFETWASHDYPPTIFICAALDFSNDGTIPEELHHISRVAASNNVLHEMPRKEPLFTNMAHLSRGAVIAFDGYPSAAAFDNIILPVSDRADVAVTGHDAVVSYLLALPPQEMAHIARQAAPHLQWETQIVGPPIPAPLFHKLQSAVIGR